MAKSIYEILADCKTETSVGNGKVAEHTIPKNLFPQPEQFESADELLAWAEENNFTHALLQKGIQKGLIDIRAAFKSVKKDEEWTPELGQENVDRFEWKITERPKAGSNAKALAQAKLDAGIEMATAMKAAKLAEKTILASLVPVYGQEGADQIMAAI